MVERVGILCQGRPVTAKDLSNLGDARPPTPDSPDAPAPGGSLEEVLAETERRKVLQVYEGCRRNKSRTARELGISRSRLDRKLKEYGMDCGSR